MLENYFQLTPIPANQMVGTYDYRLVILSYIVACLASYVALDITSRLREIAATQLNTKLWIGGGALAMGAGIWSMHFIGMLAFKMNMPMFYDPSWTVLSMIVAIAASAFALYLLSDKKIGLASFIAGGVILGFAIAAMHYTGMAAMSISMNIHYLPGLFALSILIAVIASEAALYLAIKSTEVIVSMRTRLKIVSAIIMGAAICGMHYTGMAAAIFTPKLNAAMQESIINPDLLAISIAGTTTLILSIAFIVSTYKESLNQRMLLMARQAGMAEVASSVLHNAGNILNSVNVSSGLIFEKISQSKMAELTELCQLIESHKDNLSQFIKEDPQGKNLPQYLISLANVWQTEHSFLLNETKKLIKNIQLVKNVIATQQDLSRGSSLLELYSIQNILDESTLITGVENAKQTIEVEKKYESVKPILVDKVKLLQILVNLIQNAKESVTASPKTHKKITLEIKKQNSSLLIMVKDNGVGVASDKLTKIFCYGFTTKPDGHGYGLHTSAIAAKELGGSLTVESDGIEKGATFTVELPA